MFCNLLGAAGEECSSGVLPMLPPPSLATLLSYLLGVRHIVTRGSGDWLTFAYIPASSQHLPCHHTTKTAQNAGTKYHSPPSLSPGCPRLRGRGPR